MLRWLLAALDHPRLPIFSALLAILLALPSVSGGLVADDWFHRAHLDPHSTIIPENRGYLLDLFDFFPRDSVVRNVHIESGMLPWWFSPNARGGFFRPVSAATHAFDWLVVGDHPMLHHLHSLLWMAGCVLVVGAFFREWLGVGRAAALATLFFAVDDAHAWPAAWIANRNALLALTFGVAAAWAQLRARRGKNEWFPAIFLALSLCSAEAGTATFPLLVALEIGVRATVAERARRWAPLFVVGLLWAIAWKGLGYGIQGSGLYIDPVREPLRFVLMIPERVGALSAAAWLNVPVDFWVFLTQTVSLPLGLAMGLVVAVFVRLVGVEVIEKAEGRQALALAVLGLLPTVAAFCMERVTTFGVVGVCAFLALGVAPRLGGTLRRREKFVLFWHIPMSAAMLVGKSWLVPAFMGQLGSVIDAVPHDPEMAHDQLVIVSGTEITTAYIPIALEILGRPSPAAMLVIGPAASAERVTRTGPNTLKVEFASGMLRHAIERLCRVEPFAVGETVHTTVATITVVAVTGDGHPTELSVVFAEDIDSPHLRWLAPESGSLIPWKPPALGQTINVAPLLPLPG